MIVLIDIGNTRCKYVFEHDGLISPISWLDNSDLTANWLSENWQHIKACVISNVKQSAVTEKLRSWCHAKNIPFTCVKTEAAKNGVTAAYSEPTRLGSDRWLTLLASAELFPNKNILVVDAGTATTIDLLTAQGSHLGGWISPGISSMLDSLKLNTAQVQVEAHNISKLEFGQSTTACVNNGVWAATMGLIDQAKNIAKKQHLSIDKIVITGGNGEKLSDLMTAEAVYIPALIFYGLQQYI